MSNLQDFLDKNLDSISFSNNLYSNDNLEYELGLIIKTNRLKRNISQKDLAKLTGIDQSNISRIEKGQVNITINQLKKIASALNLKIIIGLEE